MKDIKLELHFGIFAISLYTQYANWKTNLTLLHLNFHSFENSNAMFIGIGGVFLGFYLYY